MNDALEIAEINLEQLAGKRGFDPAFLGVMVPLPKLPAALQADAAPLVDGSGSELKYSHFSVVMSKARRLAYFTAVNIDGASLQQPLRKRDVWYFDPRLDRKYQTGPGLYADNELDRGHLVRRLDPVWGVEALEAQEDTFHFTNCAPQHQKLNRDTWLGLEDYVLNNSAVDHLKVTVFTGPVFREDDMVYRKKYRIPSEFWKVVVVVKSDGQLSATAYLLTQRDLLSSLELFGPYKTYQVAVSQIEALTGLSLGDLSARDPLVSALEAMSLHEINGAADIVL